MKDKTPYSKQLQVLDLEQPTMSVHLIILPYEGKFSSTVELKTCGEKKTVDESSGGISAGKKTAWFEGDDHLIPLGKASQITHFTSILNFKIVKVKTV